ncbi:MAG TPA: M28 family peptidase, partial [Chthonomonadaceae bacterium]|nr:M28 family peptidase [Chthonomonadaceae bacterium]
MLLLVAAGGAARADVPKEFQDTYRQFYSFVQPADLAATVQALTGFGSRIAGYPGDLKAAAYVAQQFKALGLENVTDETFDVTVPYDPGVDDPKKGASVQLLSGGQAASTAAPLRMYPLWPNLVRTPTLPADGLTAPLIYVHDGKLTNFNGKDVDGSVVMVDFNSGSEWLNAPRLGAKAVIFVAPQTTLRGEAEAKFISIPIAIPRFWMDPADAAPLLAACVSGRPPTVKLTCEMPWETRAAHTITGWIPGTDPQLKSQIIAVEAYYDSTSVVPALAPGADTTCGMAAMLEMIRAFKAHPPKRTMMFVATSGHFQALQGIRE